MKKYTLGIMGCGDYLKWQSSSIDASKHIEVAACFDPDQTRAKTWAGKLGGKAVADGQDIFDDPSIDVVCLFVPPWIRRKLVVEATAKGKHIIATKPLGTTVSDCAAMVRAVENASVKCGIGYRRTGDDGFLTLNKIFREGEIGALALYKQDWLHHYPEWNNWATDPKKNGGPFMDAMIHNLNIARYLMGRKASHITFFSDNHAHPDLACNDTEFMKIDFAGQGSAHLFVTWAADLAVFSKKGNDREHIDVFYMITDKGWRITTGWGDNGFAITASRQGEKRTWCLEKSEQTYFDEFALHLAGEGPWPASLPDIREAYEDIKLLKDAEANSGKQIAVDLSLA